MRTNTSKCIQKINRKAMGIILCTSLILPIVLKADDPCGCLAQQVACYEDAANAYNEECAACDDEYEHCELACLLLIWCPPCEGACDIACANSYTQCLQDASDRYDNWIEQCDMQYDQCVDNCG